MMLTRLDIVYIKHFIDARLIFGNSISIEGGVNYFLIDKSYNGLCNYNDIMLNLNDCDILIDSKYLNLISKLNKYPKLNSYYRSKGYFGISLTDERLHNKYENGDVKCYVSKIKGFNKFIKKDDVKYNKFGKWQLITPSANGNKKCFGNLIIGNPNEVYSETYISFAFDTKKEIESLFSYMKCQLPNMLLSLRKISQNISCDTCDWIPLIPLNKIWNDEEVYNYFQLSIEDIELIKIK